MHCLLFVFSCLLFAVCSLSVCCLLFPLPLCLFVSLHFFFSSSSFFSLLDFLPPPLPPPFCFLFVLFIGVPFSFLPPLPLSLPHLFLSSPSPYSLSSSSSLHLSSPPQSFHDLIAPFHISFIGIPAFHGPYLYSFHNPSANRDMNPSSTIHQKSRKSEKWVPTLMVTGSFSILTYLTISHHIKL